MDAKEEGNKITNLPVRLWEDVKYLKKILIIGIIVGAALGSTAVVGAIEAARLVYPSFDVFPVRDGNILFHRDTNNLVHIYAEVEEVEDVAAWTRNPEVTG